MIIDYYYYFENDNYCFDVLVFVSAPAYSEFKSKSSIETTLKYILQMLQKLDKKIIVILQLR